MGKGGTASSPGRVSSDGSCNEAVAEGAMSRARKRAGLPENTSEGMLGVGAAHIQLGPRCTRSQMKIFDVILGEEVVDCGRKDNVIQLRRLA